VKTKVVSDVTFQRSLLELYNNWQSKKENGPPQKAKETGARKSTQPRPGQG